MRKVRELLGLCVWGLVALFLEELAFEPRSEREHPAPGPVLVGALGLAVGKGETAF